MIFRSITLQEANVFLPILKEHLSRVTKLVMEGQAMHEKISSHGNQVDTAGGVQLAKKTKKEKEALKQIENLVRREMVEIQQYGALVKSIFPPRVDFRSERHGQPVCLSWQNGESEVSHWYPVEEGFAGRRWIEKPEEFGSTVIH